MKKKEQNKRKKVDKEDFDDGHQCVSGHMPVIRAFFWIRILIMLDNLLGSSFRIIDLAPEPDATGHEFVLVECM